MAAFEFFGGVLRRLVQDNLKAELASYYWCPVDPARGYHPRDAALIEAHQRYIRSSFFFVGVAGRMTADAEAWCIQMAGQRPRGRCPATPWQRCSPRLPPPEAPFEPAT